jgi:hypothetical protein
MPKMQLHLVVTMDDGKVFDVVADQRDYARLEVQSFAQAGIHTRMRFLSWSVMTREGKTSATWDEFNEVRCVETEAPDDTADDDETEGEQGLDPGPKTPGGGN